jgi:hypothetical protein
MLILDQGRLPTLSRRSMEPEADIEPTKLTLDGTIRCLSSLVSARFGNRRHKRETEQRTDRHKEED